MSIPDFKAMVEIHHRALRKWSQKAIQRNCVVDGNKVVWCPVRLAEVSKKHSNSTRSLLNFMCNCYYPEVKVKDSIYFVISYSERIIKFDQNKWLYSHLDDTAGDLLKKKNTLPPDQRELFDGYDNGIYSINDVIMHLVPCDAYFLTVEQEQYYIYIPIADPLDEKSISSNAVAKGKASLALNVLARRRERATFLYVDVGAWSSPQTRGVGGSAPFAIITPNEVAIFDILANNGQIKNGRGLLPGGMVKAFWDKYHQVSGGEFLFYGYVQSKGPLTVPRANKITQYSYTPFIPTPLANNEMLVIIPDLHLHLFPGFSVDNFIEPWKGGESLGLYLYSLWDYLGQFSKQTGYHVRLIQVGDLYELWESALMLLFSRSSKYLDRTSDIGVQREVIRKLQGLLKNEIKNRGLDKVFSDAELGLLENRKWNSKALSGVWNKMKLEIQKAHRIMDVRGQNVGLFKKDGKINCEDLDNWIHIGGNHDSFVSNVRPRQRGVNDLIWLEHGHLKDPKNSPAAIDSGIFFTGINVLAELKKVGDPIKGIESNRRPLFLGNAAKVNEERVFKKKKMPYSLVITGHTHRAFVSLMQVRKDLPNHFETKEVLYDSGWNTLTYTDYIKKFPYIDTVLRTGGEYPGLSTTARLIAGLLKHA